MKNPKAPLPTQLHEAKLEIDRWRQQNGRRCLIPKTWWLRAAKLTQHHSIHQVAQALRLNHGRLKAQLKESSAPKNKLTTPLFVELTHSRPITTPTSNNVALTLHVKDTQNRQMKITGANQQTALNLLQAFLCSEVKA